MEGTIKLKMFDEELELILFDNFVTKSSIKSAFFLADDGIIRLSYVFNGKKIVCGMNEQGTEFLLPNGWQTMEFLVESNKAPSRPSTSFDIAGPRKRQRLDPECEPLPVDGDLISRIIPHAWFYIKEDNMKRSAIPVTKNLAITFRHGENKELMIGDIVRLLLYQNQKINVATRVVLINETLDLIVLQSDIDELCDRNLLLEAVEPKKGMKYIMMGYSVKYEKTTHISFSTGIIVSDMTSRMRYLGSSGSFKGDSGGSCWSEDGRLIGMQVETEKVPHTTDNNGRPASPASGGRCGIIPINKIYGFIVEFLPPEDDVEYNE